MAMFPVLLASALAAMPAPAPQAAAIDPVQPALWRISDDDTTIFLFGTFHALDGTTNWFKQRVKSAFDASDELVLETILPSGNASPGSGSGPRFSGMYPHKQLAPSASLLASTRIVMSAGKARGMSSRFGADAQLRAAAESAGKPLGALETVDFQLNMFRSLRSEQQPQPAAQPVPAAQQNAATVQAVSNVLATLQDAWNRGDMNTFTPMLAQMRAQSPQTYRTMFTERNVRWAQWIAGRMQQPGTVFVAVGTGHLAGPDSVQTQLAMLGVGTTRIN